LESIQSHLANWESPKWASVKLTQTSCQIDRDQAGILANCLSLARFNSIEPQRGFCQFVMGIAESLSILQGSSLVSIYLTGGHLRLCHSCFPRSTAVCSASATEFASLFDVVTLGVVVVAVVVLVVIVVVVVVVVDGSRESQNQH